MGGLLLALRRAAILILDPGVVEGAPINLLRMCGQVGMKRVPEDLPSMRRASRPPFRFRKAAIGPAVRAAHDFWE